MTTAASATAEGGGFTFSDKDLCNARIVSIGSATGDAEQKVKEIREYFHKTMDVYENIFKAFATDDCFFVKPVHKLRHPMIFYFGHTATFIINKLALAGLTTRINPKFEETFAIGVDEMSWDDLNEAHYDWPKAQEVWNYRQLVRERIDEMLLSNRFKLNFPVTLANSSDNDDNAFFWAVMMGIEHERIHLETASVHLRELPIHMVKKLGNFWDPCTVTGDAPAENPLVAFEGGEIAMGRHHDDTLYGWDCDYAASNYTIPVAPFKASKFLVSNKDFHDFVQAGGYSEQKWWDEEGWNWVTWRKPKHPWFWVPDGNGYKLRVQVEEIELPWSWPCEVNNLEAKAYCNWLSAKTGKKLRLPTEAEWTHMRNQCVPKDMPEWGEKAPGNINMEQYRSCCPVNANKQGELYDVMGNTWQHTETPVYPYKGFRVHPLYDDFSMPTFDGRHYCQKGGAWVTTGNAATHNARFAFRRHFFQFIGIRFVEGEDVNEQRYLRNVLGMDPEVDAQADFAYGKPLDNQANFGQRLANLAIAAFEKHKGSSIQSKRALDLYCGAGRVSFELTKSFNEVLGSDFSARRLQTAYAIRERGFAQYSTVNQHSEREAVNVDASNYEWSANRENAFFYQADPTNLHAHMTNFDLVVAWNVLERCYNPSAVPKHLIGRLNAGGILIIAAHGHWDMNFVHEENLPKNALMTEEQKKKQETPAVMDLIRASLKEIAEEVDLDTDSISAVHPATHRVGTFANFELIAFRKK